MVAPASRPAGARTRARPAARWSEGIAPWLPIEPILITGTGALAEAVEDALDVQDVDDVVGDDIRSELNAHCRGSG